MFKVYLTSDKRVLALPYGVYRIGANIYSINDLGIFRTTQFHTHCISDLADYSTGECAVIEIELKAIERTIAV
jgi:hypothetical protein